MLSYLDLLRPAVQATLAETRAFVEEHRLYGQGLRTVDLMLLASVRLTAGAELWTLDKRLSALAWDFGVGFRPSAH